MNTLSASLFSRSLWVAMMSLTLSLFLWFSVFAQESDVKVIASDNEIDTESEFIEALYFAYDNGLTKYKDITTFKPYTILSREQATKMISVFAQKIMWIQEKPDTSCIFKDIKSADTSLQEYIGTSCKLGIFKWASDGNFYPGDALSKAQWLTTLIRMFEGKMLDETTDPRYLNYHLRAKELGLTKESNVLSLDRPLTRYETVILLYRLYLKYKLLNLVGTKWADEVLSFVEDQQTIDGKNTWKITVDPNLLLDKDIDHLYAKLFGNEYKIVKEKLVLQFENAYSWYWSLYLVTRNDSGDKKEEYVGNATFNIVNGTVTDWVLRPFVLGSTYYIIKMSDQPPFYTIEETSPVGTGAQDLSTWAVSSGSTIPAGSGGSLTTQSGQQLVNTPAATWSVVTSGASSTWTNQ